MRRFTTKLMPPPSLRSVFGNKSVEDLCEEGLLHEAIVVAELMEQHGIPITRDNAYLLLQECERKKDIESGRRVQFLMVHGGQDFVPVLNDYLIRLFAYHGNLLEASQVFNKVSRPNQYTWAAIVFANAKLGQGKMAPSLYCTVQISGIRVDKYISVAFLQACSVAKDLLQGKVVHDQIIRNRLESNVIVGTALVDMYCKCGSLEEAHKVFDILPERNVVSWNALIAGYVQHGGGHVALHFVELMQLDGLKGSEVTFLSMLKACASIAAIEHGRLIHEEIIDSGLHTSEVIGNMLVDMYAKCNRLQEARYVFNQLPKRDLVSWNVMIGGYSQYQECFLALDCFEKMQQEGIGSDKVTFLNIVKACGSIGAIEQGRLFHEYIIRTGFQYDIVMSNSLIDLYAKCGSLSEANKVFENVFNPDVATWNAIITGHAQHGEAFSALECFVRMQKEGIQPDNVSYASLLIACNRAGLVDEARGYFESMKECHGVIPQVFHYTCVIDLLGRAGHFAEANELLAALKQTDIKGWMSLLSACRMHDRVESGKDCFNRIVLTVPHGW